MMLTMRLCAALIAILSLLTFSNTSAQELLASNTTFPTARTSAKAPGTPKKESAEKIVLSGTITNPAGVLPGAVVILTSTKQMAVTNADGEFQFVVPANAGPLLARVTYAGYADEDMTLNASVAESTVTLANAQVIVVARKQRLKAYRKTAQKEVRRSLKQVHKK
ncbi:hypothetical protein BEN47_18125 [Hymenobacter lapidarius]|uniref:TonB-dependent receptor plug domain-containing protein n=1 Tax=Hymenobacter lapidarius TaxID=1908237 RepID=A0A1G1SW31_9BACT|nr:carboxypeptidase regulatory-like domain-containing protein [Hymenobacter lapidarius]OGX82826.1 hypothetical protein BEN47_18125 [Hymenobacter lapidarius]